MKKWEAHKKSRIKWNKKGNWIISLKMGIVMLEVKLFKLKRKSYYLCGKMINELNSNSK